MPLLLSPVCSPTHLLLLQSFFHLEFTWGTAPPPLSGGAATHFSCCWKPSSLQAHWGRWCHPHPLRLLFIYSSCGEVLPPSPVELSSHSHCYKISPLQGCWPGAPTPAFSERPSPLSGAQCACPFCYVFLFSCLFIIQFVFFLFFPWVGVGLSRGLC
jgi:hypothetical protein